MKEEIAKMWSAALRSNKFAQMKGALANPKRTHHCCYGVLCELAMQNGVEVETRVNEHDEMVYGGNSALPPKEIAGWARLKTGNGILNGVPGGSLVGMNDAGHSFTEIADVIERRWSEI